MKIKILLGLLAFLLVLTGCAKNNGQKKLGKEDPTNPFVNESGKTYIENLKENAAAWNNTSVEAQEKAKVVTLEENGSIYYFAADGKRYIFPTPETYQSWYKDYQPEDSMTLEEMQKVPLGGNVTVRPGSLISTPTDFNIYLVTKGGIIRPVDKNVLKKIHGDEYEKLVLSLPNYYFTNYNYGDTIGEVKDYPLVNITLTIDQDKGF